jgi:uncharacterized protein YdaL
MFKRLLFLSIVFIFLSQGIVFAEGNQTLVLYDAFNYYGDGRDAVSSISNLLRHFDQELTYSELNAFEGDLGTYDYVMVLCFRDNPVNERVLKQLSTYEKPILWIGKCLNQLTDLSNHEMTRYGEVNNLTRVVYKDRFYDIGIKRYFEQVFVGDSGYVYSYLYDGAQKYPFIMREDNLYYVSRMDLNEPLFYIFSDVLYDFFQKPISHGQRVFIKIADVNPYTDSELLLDKAKYLLERRIPFAVSVNPIYREEGSRYSTPLSEREDLVKVLKFIQENDQALIVQGGTQFFGEEGVRGESYFAWLGGFDEDASSDEKSVFEWSREFMNLALEECGLNELYPIGFEGAHYALSKEAYTYIGQVFDLYIGSLQTNDWQETITVYPWALSDVNGIHRYIPDNLGVFSGSGTSELQQLKYNLDKMDIVSEFVGGVSISSELELRELAKLVQFLQDRQMSFYNIKEHSVEVRGETVHVISNLDQLVGESALEMEFSPVFSAMDILVVIVLMGLTFVFFLFYKMFRASKAKTDDNLF